eukprot:2820836-Amphidinium_carterae.1
MRVKIAQEARGADPFGSCWNFDSLGTPGVYHMREAVLVGFGLRFGSFALPFLSRGLRSGRWTTTLGGSTT